MSSFDDYNEGMHDSWNCKPPKDKNINYEMGYYSHQDDSDDGGYPHFGRRHASEYNAIDAVIDAVISFIIAGAIISGIESIPAIVCLLILFGVLFGVVFLHMLLKEL